MNCDLENAMVLPEPPASDWQADAAYAAEQADQRNDSRASDELFQIISGAMAAQARALRPDTAEDIMLRESTAASLRGATDVAGDLLRAALLLRRAKGAE